MVKPTPVVVEMFSLGLGNLAISALFVSVVVFPMKDVVDGDITETDFCH
jgi:hypothetical protein